MWMKIKKLIEKPDAQDTHGKDAGQADAHDVWHMRLKELALPVCLEQRVKPPYSEGVRLNLGCGNDYRAGWVNVDMHASHKVDMVSDVTWLKEIADQTCVEILAQDVLEHISRPRASTALLEWNRVLQPSGWLTVRVPSLVHLLGLLTHPARQDIPAQKELIQCLYGTQGYDGDFHLNGYTAMTLQHDLAQAGFALGAVRIVDDWMFEVDACKEQHMVPDALLRISTDEAFLHAAFQKLLGRAPDAEGARYYGGVLRQGIAREAVLNSLMTSEEHCLFVSQAAASQ